MKSLMRTMAALGLTAGMALAAASTAHASVVSYTFNGVNGDLGNSVVVSAGLTVTAYRSTPSSGWTSSGVTVARNTNAIGVDRGTDSNPGQIDSNLGLVEGLLFDFGTDLFSTAQLTLSQYAAADRLDLWVGSSFVASNLANPLANQVFANAGPANPFTVQLNYNRFLFIAAAADPSSTANSCSTGVNCFRVDNLMAVPEPASLALVGAAMLAAGAARRRKS